MSTDALFGEDLQPTAGARWSDDRESWDAARSLSRDALRESTLWVLNLLRSCPRAWSDEEIEVDARCCDRPWSPQRLRSARADLVKFGLVEWTGEYDTTARKRRCKTWRAVARRAA